MNSEWLKVIIAAFFEVFWVIGLKHANHILEWLGTALAILISFYLMIMAGKKLPVGTVYSVFVGIGTAGTVLSEIIFFGEPFKSLKLILIMILLAGIIGLKIISQEEEEEKGVSES